MELGLGLELDGFVRAQCLDKSAFLAISAIKGEGVGLRQVASVIQVVCRKSIQIVLSQVIVWHIEFHSKKLFI